MKVYVAKTSYLIRSYAALTARQVPHFCYEDSDIGPPQACTDSCGEDGVEGDFHSEAEVTAATNQLCHDIPEILMAILFILPCILVS